MLRVNAKSGEIFIYDVIGPDWFDGGITSQMVIDALGSLGGKRASVRINSPGGIADEGIAIYNALKRYEGGVDTYIDALAASAASVIALAGEKRTTAKGARWMIHRAMAMAVGNVNDMQKAVAQLSAYDASLVEIYGEYIDKTPEEITALIDAETWFTASEALAVGLATAVDGESDAEPVVANWFKNAPSALLAKPTAVAKPVSRMCATKKWVVRA